MRSKYKEIGPGVAWWREMMGWDDPDRAKLALALDERPPSYSKLAGVRYVPSEVKRWRINAVGAIGRQLPPDFEMFTGNICVYIGIRDVPSQNDTDNYGKEALDVLQLPRRGKLGAGVLVNDNRVSSFAITALPPGRHQVVIYVSGVCGNYCNVCMVAKDAGEFHRHPRAYNGLMTACKECQGARAKARRAAYRAKGLCVTCGKWAAVPGQGNCESCRDRKNALRRKTGADG